MKTVFLGLGSNLGDREGTLKKALDLLRAEPFLWIEHVAPFIETEPVSPIPQPHYINTAVKAKTLLTPAALLQVTTLIEKKLGRVNKGTKEARTLDIDLLFYDQEIICSKELTIPHPLLHERSFVLIPLYELAPEFQHPILEETISEIHDRVVGY